jgi:hypothetical protein
MDDTSYVNAFPENSEGFHDRFDASSELDPSQLEELTGLAKKVHPMRFKSVNEAQVDNEAKQLVDLYFPHKSDRDGQSGDGGRYGSYKLGLLAKELEDLGYEKEQISDTETVYTKENTPCVIHMDTAFGDNEIPYAWCEEPHAEPETSEVIGPDGNPIEIPRTNEGAFQNDVQLDNVNLEFNPDTNMIYGSIPVFGSDQNGGEEEVEIEIEYNIATQAVKFLPSIEDIIQDGVEDGVYFDVDEMTREVKDTIKTWAQSNDIKVYEDSCDNMEEETYNPVRSEEQQEVHRLIGQVGNDENGIQIVAKRMGKSVDEVRKLLDDNLSEEAEESYVDYVQRMLQR